MADLHPIWRYSVTCSLLFLHFLTLIAEPISSFSIQNFDSENPNFDSKFALFGNARIGNGSSVVNLTSPSVSGSGQIIYKKPVKFFDEKSQNPISFSTDFTFSISAGDGDGLAFVIVPNGELPDIFGLGLFGISEGIRKIDRRFVAVEYDTRKDDNVGDPNDNHVGINVGSFVSDEISDVSSIDLVLKTGEKLRSWIDYEASSKRLDIRLSKSGSKRPYNPLISHPIDLSKIWGEREVLVGLSSSNGNSKQISSLYSWRFGVRTVSKWMHSQPLDPEEDIDNEQNKPNKKNCALTILGGLIFATGCGTLVAFFVLFVWVVFFNRNPIVTSELPMSQVDFRYEKVDVTVDDMSNESRS